MCFCRHEVIGNAQTKYCKFVLGVRSTANNCAALRECGRLQLSCIYQRNCIKFQLKLQQMPRSGYIRSCYLMAKSCVGFDIHVYKYIWHEKFYNMFKS